MESLILDSCVSPTPLTTGLIIANAINDANLLNIYNSATPDLVTLSGAPYYPRLQAYYNRRQNFCKNAISMSYGGSFNFSICVENRAFLERGYIKFRTEPVTLNENNPYVEDMETIRKMS